MKIGISTDGPGMDAEVGARLGTAEYLLVIDSNTMEVIAVPNPGASSLNQAGIQAVILAITQKLDVLLTGYLSPVAEKHLTGNGIRVMRGISGKASDAFELCRQELIEAPGRQEKKPEKIGGAWGEMSHSIKSSARQFGRVVPVMVGVVMVIGLFQTFMGKGVITSLFSSHGVLDAFWGALAGSLFAGNPINSYILAGGFLEQGASLLAVTAFMVAWVSVGLLQLPAEIGALGRRFALTRNGLAFLFSMCIAAFTVAGYRVWGG